MIETATMSPGMTLTLNAEEREQLLNFLEQSLRTTMVEEHRTDARAYREHVRHKETVIKGLIDKLHGVTGAETNP